MDFCFPGYSPKFGSFLLRIFLHWFVHFVFLFVFYEKIVRERSACLKSYLEWLRLLGGVICRIGVDRRDGGGVRCKWVAFCVVCERFVLPSISIFGGRRFLNEKSVLWRCNKTHTHTHTQDV